MSALASVVCIVQKAKDGCVSNWRSLLTEKKRTGAGDMEVFGGKDTSSAFLDVADHDLALRLQCYRTLPPEVQVQIVKVQDVEHPGELLRVAVEFEASADSPFANSFHENNLKDRSKVGRS